jgi:hypothetical protein
MRLCESEKKSVLFQIFQSNNKDNNAMWYKKKCKINLRDDTD